MFCKRCNKLYTLDLRMNRRVFFRCENDGCGYQEDIPWYLYYSIETMMFLNNKIEMIFCCRKF